ncbi:hypothetical protein MNAN1_001405 [Malassezia nana]|uniref:Uncharacterized protein n=1 Tax=Malassezia nana TaxID=180528 RepID=A0AAF0J364_9BASI|nr:hypothetical protein MNAN1_001405 [Malassezia nana]
MAKAVAQNEYLDFLREIVPTTIPLPVALKQREERMQADVGQADNVPENELEEEEAVDESMMEEPEADTSEWQTLDENATEENEALGASTLSEKTEVLEAEEAWRAPAPSADP